MEIQRQEEIDDYSADKSDLLKQEFLKKYDDPKVWQNSWFAMNEPCDEDARMRVVVALLVYELTHNKITPEMIGELEYYYDEAFTKKTLENLFDEPESKEKCFADLEWCYNTAKEKGLL